MAGMRCAVVVLGMALLIGAASEKALAQATRGLGQVSGTVTSDSGEPIDGVAVKIVVGSEALTGTSGADGKWVVGGLGKGEFIADFTKAAFESKSVRLLIPKESLKPTPIKISLKKS